MDSSLIGKVEKATRYAKERGRIQFRQMLVSFQGDNGPREVSYREGAWSLFLCLRPTRHGICSHTMALDAHSGADAPGLFRGPSSIPQTGRR